MSIQKTTPAQRFRDEIRKSTPNFLPSSATDIDTEFHAYLEAEYLSACANWSDLPLEAVDKRRKFANGIYFFAVGLLTYGHLDVVKAILQMAPPTGNARWLLNTVKVLIPWPTGLDPVNSPTEVLSWLNLVKNRLVFDESAGRFILR